LEHPGIVPVHDAGTLADGRTFYCMKYVEGQNLGEFIVGRGLRECLQLLQRIAEPLAFAHSRGIIHRDLKPGNVMVGRFGEVLVMDWGLAKLTSDQSNGRKTVQSKSTAASKNNEASTLALPPASLPAPTAHGTVLGTPGFMAPEQERGDIEAIDERTDVFGLGAVLNFMLESAKKQGPDAGKSISKPLAAIRDQAMAADQAQRYSSVLALSADIGLYLDGLPVSAYPENVWERGARLFARHQVAVVLVLAYLLMRLSFALFSSR
jgi:serine/threonine-protein kinase